MAQQYIKEIDSSLSLLIFDCVRPHHIQQLMWDTLKMPINEKTKFLSNPKNHSIHNYGAAVDLTISKNSLELNMGTPYDYIGKEAYPRMESHFLSTGYLTSKHIANRKLLRKVMKHAGFTNITTEWWHFNSCSRSEAKRKYKLIK
jgi:D-alanyl-D-alanine dipeptidase